jgi:hypothetical protein
MSRDSAPPVATWLIDRVLPESDREAIHWGQVCRSIPQMFWSSKGGALAAHDRRRCGCLRRREHGRIPRDGGDFGSACSGRPPVYGCQPIVWSRDGRAGRILRRADSAGRGTCRRHDCGDRHCHSIRDNEAECAALVRSHLPGLWPIGGVGWWNCVSRQTYRSGGVTGHARCERRSG